MNKNLVQNHIILNFGIDHEKIEDMTSGWDMFFENTGSELCHPHSCTLKKLGCQDPFFTIDNMIESEYTIPEIMLLDEDNNFKIVAQSYSTNWHFVICFEC